MGRKEYTSRWPCMVCSSARRSTSRNACLNCKELEASRIKLKVSAAVRKTKETALARARAELAREVEAAERQRQHQADKERRAEERKAARAAEARARQGLPPLAPRRARKGARKGPTQAECIATAAALLRKPGAAAGTPGAALALDDLDDYDDRAPWE